MIEKFLNIKNSLRNISDEEFEVIIPILASELENVSFNYSYSDSDLLKDWNSLIKC